MAKVGSTVAADLRKARISLPILVLALAVLAYAVYFSYLTLVRYAAFEARALDMGNLDQAVWNTARGNWFHLTNQPGTVNRLSLHVEPILLPISWLYWLRSGPPTLLVLQAVVVALGAVPLFALARSKLHNPWPALAFAAAYLLNPSIQAANWLEFHPLTLAPTFLLAAFYFLVEDRPGWFALFAILTAACKEEMALLVLMMGLYATLALHRRRLGFITMALSLLWALLAVFVIQNVFAAGNIHWSRYAYLGAGPAQMVLTLVTRPAVVFSQLRAAGALAYVEQLLFPVGFLALLAPEVFLLALPSLALNLLADFPPMHEVHDLIYAAPIVPFVLAATLYGVARLSRWAARWRPSMGLSVNTRMWAIGGATLLLLLCTGVDQRLYGYTPLGRNYHLYPVTAHDRRAAAIIAQIPPDAKVSAQDRLNPHVSGRETVYIFPRIDDADTVLVDVTGPSWPQHPNDLHATIQGLLSSGFGIAAADDGYLLLRKSATNRLMPSTFYTAWQRPDYAPALSPPIDFGGQLRLVDYAVVVDSHGELVVRLDWQTLQSLNRTVHFYVAYADGDGNILHDTRFYPPVADLWYPTSMWQPGMTVLVQTLPWTLAQDKFTLLVGAFTGTDGWPQGRRLRISDAQRALPRLENDTLLRLGGYRQTDAGHWTQVPLRGAPRLWPWIRTWGTGLFWMA